MYKLNPKNGRVDGLLKTGKDYVKCNITTMAAQHIIDNGKLNKPKFNDYPINIDDVWHFKGLIPVNNSKKGDK